MSNPKQKSKEEVIERISAGEDIPELQKSISQVFLRYSTIKLHPKDYRMKVIQSHIFIMKVQDVVSNTFESYSTWAKPLMFLHKIEIFSHITRDVYHQ